MFNKLYFYVIINWDKYVDVKYVIDVNVNFVKWFILFWDFFVVLEDVVVELFGGWLMLLFYCLFVCFSGILGFGILNLGMCMFLEIW